MFVSSFCSSPQRRERFALPGDGRPPRVDSGPTEGLLERLRSHRLCHVQGNFLRERQRRNNLHRKSSLGFDRWRLVVVAAADRNPCQIHRDSGRDLAAGAVLAQARLPVDAAAREGLHSGQNGGNEGEADGEDGGDEGEVLREDGGD